MIIGIGSALNLLFMITFFTLLYSNSKISGEHDESYMDLILRLPYQKICPECKL